MQFPTSLLVYSHYRPQQDTLFNSCEKFAILQYNWKHNKQKGIASCYSMSEVYIVNQSLILLLLSYHCVFKNGYKILVVSAA